MGPQTSKPNALNPKNPKIWPLVPGGSQNPRGPERGPQM